MVTLCLSVHSFVSLELYCKDHFAAGMSQIPVLPILVLRERKVCLSSPCWAETKPSGRSASASRKNGWQVQRNLEEGEPLGKETPVDAWEELQEAMRHSSSLPLTPKHSWHCMCHPWQPAFTETHLLLQLFEYHLQLHKMSGQPSKSSCCSECKSAVQCKARRCCPPTTPPGHPVCFLGPCENTDIGPQRAFGSVTHETQKLRILLFWNIVVSSYLKAEVFSLTLLPCWSSISLLSAQGTSLDSP